MFLDLIHQPHINFPKQNNKKKDPLPQALLENDPNQIFNIINKLCAVTSGRNTPNITFSMLPQSYGND